MPVEIRAVSKEEFQAWLATAKQEFSALDLKPYAQYALLQEQK
jgi:heme/copper-type cytochrome/quinol oxidase subunit 2